MNNISTLEDIKKESPFPIGQKNDAYAKYFTGQSYLNMLSLKQVVVGNIIFEEYSKLK